MRWRAGLLAVFLLGWLIVLLPLKAVMMIGGGSEAFGYRDVYGTVWSGRVYGMQINGTRVRDIALSLDPASLLLGRLNADWEVFDDSLRGRGETAISGEWLQAQNVSVTASLSRLGLPDLPGFRGDEQIRISVLELEMDGDRCLRAAGDVRSDAVAILAETYGYEGPVLDGVLSCQNERLVLDLSGQSADLDLNGRVSFTQTGYDWSVDVATPRSELAEAFALLGLERDGERWRGAGDRSYDG